MSPAQTGCDESFLDAIALSVNEALPLIGKNHAFKALSSLEEALEELPPQKNDENARIASLRAVIRDGMARAAFAIGRREEGIAMFEEGAKSLIAWLKNAENDQNLPGPDRQKISRMLTGLLQNLCFALLESNQAEKARLAGCQAVEWAEKLLEPGSSALAGALFGLSAVFYRQRQLEKAEELTLRARDIWLCLGDDEGEEKAATCLNNLGRIYEERGEIDKGINFHRQAVAARKKLPNELDLAFSLGNLGVALASAGKWREAAENLEEALALYDGNNLAQSREREGYAKNLEVCRRKIAEEN